MWLKEIGDPSLPNAKNMQPKIEASMKPYFKFVTKQNTSMRFWRVGALRTKPFAKSQYKKWGNKLHADYGEAVMKRQANEHPMSMIMALDKFEFLYQNPLEKYDDDNNDDNEDDDDNNDNDSDKGGMTTKGQNKYTTMTVQKGQVVAFTNDFPHAGRLNRKKQSSLSSICLHCKQ